MTALDDVTVDFPAAVFTPVMGPSGSGKSTLMHCLAGLDRARLVVAAYESGLVSPGWSDSPGA